jgi:hypothetical protein
MKQKALYAFMVCAFMACNNSDTKKGSADEARVKSATTAEEPEMDYAYTIKYPDQWEWGSRANTKTVLQALKDFENGKIEDCLKAFGDSVELRFDGVEGKFSKDSLRAMFTRERNKVKDFTIEMDDFVSVKSKGDQQQWVSLWKKQKWQDQNGKQDSAFMMDDYRIQDGRIVVLDEKLRRFGKKM